MWENVATYTLQVRNKLLGFQNGNLWSNAIVRFPLVHEREQERERERERERKRMCNKFTYKYRIYDFRKIKYVLKEKEKCEDYFINLTSE